MESNTAIPEEKKDHLANKPRLKKAIEELKEYCFALTPDDLKLVGMDDFDWDEYLNQFTHISDAMASVECQKLLKSLTKDYKWHFDQEKREKAGITVYKLLARYNRLPASWKVFVRSMLSLSNDTDEGLFKMFAILSCSPDRASQKEFNDVLDHIHKTMSEIEAAEGLDSISANK